MSYQVGHIKNRQQQDIIYKIANPVESPSVFVTHIVRDGEGKL